MEVAFLDRDGVINKDTGYLYKIDEFEFTEGCIEALSLLQQKGFSIIVVTNQSGIGRGYYTEADYQMLTQWYRQQLSDNGITITAVFHCPHKPEDQCTCRKPKPGLFLQAKARYPEIDFLSSIMVGDKLSDIQAAQSAGIERCFLISDVNLTTCDTLSFTQFNSLFDCVKAL